MRLTLIKDVLKKDYKWLKQDFKKGEVLYLFTGETYGCIGENGIACSLDGNLPFFELPTTVLSVKHDEIEYGIFMAEQNENNNIFYCKEFPIDHLNLLKQVQANRHLLEHNKAIIQPEYKIENRILKVSIKQEQIIIETSQLEDIKPLF